MTGVSQRPPALEPAIIVIFGITGDLASRYLLPALYRLFRDDLIHDQTEIVGISRRELDLDGLFAKLSQSDPSFDPAVVDRIRQHTTSFQLDMDDISGYVRLLEPSMPSRTGKRSV